MSPQVPEGDPSAQPLRLGIVGPGASGPCCGSSSDSSRPGCCIQGQDPDPSIPAAMLCASSPLPAVPPTLQGPPHCSSCLSVALVPPELCFLPGGLGITVLALPFACSQSPGSTLSISMGPSAVPGLSLWLTPCSKPPMGTCSPVCLAGVLKPKSHQIPAPRMNRTDTQMRGAPPALGVNHYDPP